MSALLLCIICSYLYIFSQRQVFCSSLHTIKHSLCGYLISSPISYVKQSAKVKLIPFSKSTCFQSGYAFMLLYFLFWTWKTCFNYPQWELMSNYDSTSTKSSWLSLSRRFLVEDHDHILAKTQTQAFATNNLYYSISSLIWWWGNEGG